MHEIYSGVGLLATGGLTGGQRVRQGGLAVPSPIARQDRSVDNYRDLVGRTFQGEYHAICPLSRGYA